VTGKERQARIYSSFVSFSNLIMSAIVVGGAGALGRSLVKTLQKNSFKAISVDMMKNEEASVNITLSNSTPLEKQMGDLRAQVAEAGAVAGVFSSVGSWMGGSIGDDDFLQTMENMKRTNLDSALMAAHLSSKFLDKNGALVLTGADAALGATPGSNNCDISRRITWILIHVIFTRNDCLRNYEMFYSLSS